MNNAMYSGADENNQSIQPLYYLLHTFCINHFWRKNSTGLL